MKVFKKIISTGEKTLEEYPRHDLGEIIGLDKDIKFYLVIDDPKPIYDDITQELVYNEEFTGEMHPDYPAINLVRGRWTITPRILLPVSDRQVELKEQLKDLIIEMSSIITAVKNKYDPFDEDKTLIPSEFKVFVKNIQQIRKRVESDIDTLATEEVAARYNVYTDEATQLLTQLKSYL